jgi:hypothetical protein
MTIDERVIDLMDQATAHLPERWRSAPLPAIRRRIRQRRHRAVAATALGLVAILGIGVGLAQALPGGQRQRGGQPPQPTPQPTEQSEGRPVPWQVVRVDRAGTGLTVYANPPAGTCEFQSAPVISVEYGPDKVVVTVHGSARPEPRCAGGHRASVTPAHLVTPLGDRPIVDGATDRPGLRLFDTELPLPIAWQEAPASYSDRPGTTWPITFTRPGDVSVVILAQTPAVAGQPAGQPLGTIAVGSHQAPIYAGSHGLEVRWQARDLIYTLFLTADDSSYTVPMPVLRNTVGALHWDQ